MLKKDWREDHRRGRSPGRTRRGRCGSMRAFRAVVSSPHWASLCG